MLSLQSNEVRLHNILSFLYQMNVLFSKPCSVCMSVNQFVILPRYQESPIIADHEYHFRFKVQCLRFWTSSEKSPLFFLSRKSSFMGTVKYLKWAKSVLDKAKVTTLHYVITFEHTGMSQIKLDIYNIKLLIALISGTLECLNILNV